MDPGYGSYNVIRDYGLTPEDAPYDVSSSPYWIIAVFRLNDPLTYSRERRASVSIDVTRGALLRNPLPLVISDDCLQLSVQNSKSSHTSSMSAVMKQTEMNYLREILPGDWAMGWIVNNKADFDRLLGQLKDGKACNKFNDGLKFVGRVTAIGKNQSVDRGSGTKTSSYHLSCTGFHELDTMLFYDFALATGEEGVLLGSWLGRLGLEINTLFGESADHGVQDRNMTQIMTTILELIVGKGPNTETRSQATLGITSSATGERISAQPSLDNSAPFSYLVPTKVAATLGVGWGLGAKVVGYSDIMWLQMGVQNYLNRGNDYNVFIPEIRPGCTGSHQLTPVLMLGTFPALMPEFTNKPLWDVLGQFLNPTINEMYTGLRVNTNGDVMPTLVVRQMPFTTEAFDVKQVPVTATGGMGEGRRTDGTIPFTKFLSLPRWQIPSILISDVSIGRNDGTHFNFIHVYGNSSMVGGGFSIQQQIQENPPIRDDLDIMRSGLRSYMTTVECWTSDQVGDVPKTWMALIADRLMGSQFTFNGTVKCLGIQSPICQGDNMEFDGVVYHIQDVSHQASIDMMGNKTWTTSLELVNGLRATTGRQESGTAFPLYPGFEEFDNTFYDPGLSLEQRASAGGVTKREDDFDTGIRETRQKQEAAELAKTEEKKG